jgi:hypothetical protein
VLDEKEDGWDERAGEHLATIVVIFFMLCCGKQQGHEVPVMQCEDC